MAVSRPLLIVLLGAVLSCATFFAMRGASNSAGADQAAVPVAKPPAAKPATAAKPSKPAKAHAAKPAAKPEAAKAKAVAKPEPSAKPKPAVKPAKPAPAGVPAKVARALDGKHVVVLFFRQPGAADDDATAQAVAAVRGRGVAVFSDRIAHLARYRGVVSGLGVSQAPVVVVVDRHRKAQLVEGFVDEGTLRQIVVDAR